jgi:glycosyltransferase involved in cell wall biosynthesis
VDDTLSSLAPLLTALVALVGALIGLRTYLDARRKERLDRIDAELKDVLEKLFDEDARVRAVGAFALQSFLTPERSHQHLHALSALQAAVQREMGPGGYRDELVSRGLRFAAARAGRSLPPDMLRQMSWRWINLSRLDFAEASLAGVDLRDAVLEDADLSGADLSGALLMGAKLRGAKLQRSNLRGANLSSADLAGATLAGSDLREASLYGWQVRDLDLDQADLSGARLDANSVRWEQILNWRTATLDSPLRERLLRRYGPAPSGPRVLMLMWEIPPLVAGGTWTASYHLVRSLRRHGADVTVVVPWHGDTIASAAARPFDSEVDVVPLGMFPPEAPASAYGGPVWSPYGSGPQAGYPWSPYASPYAPGSGSPWSPYASAPGPYPGTADPDLWEGSLTLRLVEQFRQRVVAFCADADFELIHAHDWVTFPAAKAAAEAVGRPWVAHFHSTVLDRQSRSDPFAAAIERQGAQTADRVLAPSSSTAAKIAELAGLPAKDIEVVPNPLSDEETALDEVGSFESRRVLFLGRLTEQKGPDLFVQIARAFDAAGFEATFEIVGSGELRSALAREAGLVVQLRDPVEWSQRGRAYAGASAVIVPSRHEPFGMVVAEAMIRRVPVLYPTTAGIAEVIPPRLPIDPFDAAATATTVHDLLGDLSRWEQTVEEQRKAIAAYREQEYERLVQQAWLKAAATVRA